MQQISPLFFRSFPRRAKAALAASVLCSMALLAGCKPSDKPAAAVPANGTISKTVVVFDLASLDTLKVLDVEITGVPAFTYPPALADYSSDRYKKVGSLFEPDYEAVNALAPDLIIVGGRSSPKYADLAKIAPTIDLPVDIKHFKSSVFANIRTLAQRFGKVTQAEAKIQALEKSIAELKTKTADKGKGLLILTTGGRISAYGSGSRFGVIHDEYGVSVAAPDISEGNHGQPVSFEFIRQVDPDWLFVVDRDAAIGKKGVSAKQLLDNELIRNTRAWKRNQVVYLDPAGWYLIGGGLGAMQKNVNDLLETFEAKR
ncbi:MAG: siderophore ABC transporter substrate-binding protein [Oxalobacter sp.]|nr:siderophore ABC transporter substrate-binding protein [Oxalobacter sp.]